MTKVHNFSAGPGILPAEVLKQASEACINFDNLNLSLLEISHRSKNYEKVMDEARSLRDTAAGRETPIAIPHIRTHRPTPRNPRDSHRLTANAP